VAETGGRYTTTAIVLHWLTAVLVLVTVPIGLVMPDLAKGPLQDRLYVAHKAIGVLVLLVLVVRLAWRATHPPPPLAGLVARWEMRLAHAVHGLLYAALAVMAVSGYVHLRAGGFPIEVLDALGLPPLVPRHEALAKAAQAVHGATAWLLVGLVLLHVAGALKHVFVGPAQVLARMLPGDG
jgi:cytochrome b561